MRPDFGGRRGLGGAGAAAIAGAGLANRVDGNRPGNLPGLGDRPGINQLPANRPIPERRQALQDRLAGDARPGQLPPRDWGQVRQDWQTHRDDVRQNWQNYRDQARDDWQGFFADHYPWHSGWYAGYAPGYWGSWDYLWDQYPVASAIGLTWWGVNSIANQFGYSDYYNPYYADSAPYNYAEPIFTEPITVATQENSGLPAGVSSDVLKTFDQARVAFFDGDYQNALKLADETLTKLPHDAAAHEFRALVLFALQRYSDAAAAINAVLAAGPGWDAKTLLSLYPNVDTYTAQLRALEAYRNQNLMAADIRFLVGYHYLSGGYPKEALDEFKSALALQPKDSVSAALVASLAPRDAPASTTVADAAPKSIPSDSLVGEWTAAGKKDSKYTMNLQKDGGFTWAFTRGVRKQEVKGVYTVEGNVLALEPDTGGVLLAELTVKQPGTVHFKMIGDAANNPGLEFQSGKGS
jgi:uncharacterized protein (TIGR03066 family)